MSTKPFEVKIPQTDLDDLHERLDRTRWVPEDDFKDWGAGTSPAYLRQLVDYWRAAYTELRHRKVTDALATWNAPEEPTSCG